MIGVWEAGWIQGRGLPPRPCSAQQQFPQAGRGLLQGMRWCLGFCAPPGALLPGDGTLSKMAPARAEHSKPPSFDFSWGLVLVIKPLG